jgi:hypothetical protein
VSVIKRIQKNGSARALVLSKKHLTYLGFSADDLEQAYVRVEMIGGALVVTREGAPVPNQKKRSEVLREVDLRRSGSVILKDGADLKLTGPRLALCEVFWREGVMRPSQVVEKLGIGANAVYVQLKRAKEEKLIVKRGGAYSLNPKYFDL